MLMKMKQFITAMLVLVMSVSILAVPASAETEALTAKINVAVKIDGYQPEQKDTYEIHVVPGSSNFPMPSGGEGGVYKILGQGTKELVFNSLINHETNNPLGEQLKNFNRPVRKPTLDDLKREQGKGA